jgi:hypothetical protein
VKNVIDQHFTPPELAACLVNLLDKGAKRVADFAVGQGSLLSAASARWPSASMVGTDIDPSLIRQLRSTWPKWSVGRCDFLTTTSRQHSPVLKTIEREVDLILLNPPFSYRGGARQTVTLGETDVTCTVAPAFIAESLRYLKPGGRLAAILPANSPQSECDARFYRQLGRLGSFEVLGEFGPYSFPDARSASVVALFNLSDAAFAAKSPRKRTKRRTVIRCSLVRGIVPMNSVGMAGLGRHRLIHTTGLLEHEAHPVLRRVIESHRRVEAPAILIPRVGRPDSRKVCMYTSRLAATMSDCLFALQFPSVRQAQSAYRVILEAWPRLR